MRILVCAAVCVAAAVGPAWAQGPTQPERRPVEAGVKAGVARGSLAVSGLPGFEPESGIGGFAGAWISAGDHRVRFQTELTVGRRRFSSASPIGDIAISSRVVEVPMLIVGRLRSAGRTRPVLIAGPYFSFISGTTQTVGGNTIDIDDEIKGVDAGLLLGAGLEADAGRGALVVDVRYAMGIRDLSEAAEATFKSRTLIIAVGYRF